MFRFVLSVFFLSSVPLNAQDVFFNDHDMRDTVHVSQLNEWIKANDERFFHHITLPTKAGNVSFGAAAATVRFRSVDDGLFRLSIDQGISLFDTIYVRLPICDVYVRIVDGGMLEFFSGHAYADRYFTCDNSDDIDDIPISGFSDFYRRYLCSFSNTEDWNRVLDAVPDTDDFRVGAGALEVADCVAVQRQYARVRAILGQ